MINLSKVRDNKWNILGYLILIISLIISLLNTRVVIKEVMITKEIKKDIVRKDCLKYITKHKPLNIIKNNHIEDTKNINNIFNVYEDK